ncbi:hypothetical protein [Bacteroides caecimuris]|jgi:hypothetical protein|uniref:hypothetical protein n=1 Tax=Bacteroides caecimuris TaxID=1796613 RepID=UPI00256FCA5F|nr:hypothetical protein [Bacteroides caecimuris]
MEKRYYQYGNIIRVLHLQKGEAASVMIDINIEDGTILSIFNASNKFDSDFIQAFLNITECSNTGFRQLSNNKEDAELISKSLEIINNNQNTLNVLVSK